MRLLPLGDSALVARFADRLDEAANRRAIQFATMVMEARLPGVLEVAPGLVSVLVRYDPGIISLGRLSGELSLMSEGRSESSAPSATVTIDVQFNGADLDDVARQLRVSTAEIIAAHTAQPLRVLATGFAPGFLYCGLHPAKLAAPRRRTVRSRVPAGTVLFAAGQTAITSSPIPTGWHVIGETAFRNFDPSAVDPLRLRAGDYIVFSGAPP